MSRERTAMLENLMEEAIRPDNWEAALRAVERNKGAPGPDGMKACELRAHPVMQEALNNKKLRRCEFLMPSDLTR